MKVVESLAPGKRLGIGPPDSVRPGSGSVTVTPVSVTLPVLVTVKAKVIGSPTAGGAENAGAAVLTSAIAGVSASGVTSGASSPFVVPERSVTGAP